MGRLGNCTIIVVLLAIPMPYIVPALFRFRSFPLDPVVGNVEEVGDEILTERITGKKALVVGGTRGIGRGIALQLAKYGADVSVVGRNAQGGSAVVQSMQYIESESQLENQKQFEDDVKSGKRKRKHHSYAFDLSTVKGCQAFAKRLEVLGESFDYLVMTLGIWPDWENPNTADGLNKVFAIDNLARFILIQKLRKLLKPGARVMSVLASTMKTGYIDESVIKDVVTGKINEFGFGNMPELMLTAATVGDVMLEQAGKRFPEVRFIGTHPGLVATELLDNTFPKWVTKPAMTLLLFLGVLNTESACGRIHATILSSENVEKRQTTYFNFLLDGRKTINLAYDDDFGKWLWQTLEEMMIQYS